MVATLYNRIKILGIFTLILSFTACTTSNILSEVKNTDDSGNVRNVISGPLKPLMDSRFAYRKAIAIKDGGDYLHAPYNEFIDINDRDEIPVRKVKEGWIRRLSARDVQDITYIGGTEGEPKNHKAFAVGKTKGGSAMTVVFLHGRHGTRELGFDDERFGGNFNRLKRLMLQNRGAYFSPNFTDHENAGENDILALLKKQRPLTNGKLILACGSLGSNICWGIVNNPKNKGLVDGMVLLGGMPNQHFLKTSTALNKTQKFPIYIAHATLDNSFSYQSLIAFYKSLKVNNYPVRMTLFESGKHGTPVRMVDWRQALNWIASK